MTSHSALPRWRDPGVAASLAAALLFGAAAPLAKLLLQQISPWLLAALLYLGSGLGLALLRRLRRDAPVRLPAGEGRWLAGAVLAGGIAGPVLLMLGLAGLPASQASLLLNGEGVFTALLAWFVFRENVDRRVALGMLAIVAGGVVLAWPGAGAAGAGNVRAALLVLAACLAWAIDNNLTRKVSLADASWIAMVKGLAAGATNLALALALGAAWPPLPAVGAAGLLGFVSYGLSLVLFVLGLRALGTARTGAYFSVAPFFGAVLAVLLLGEAFDARLALAGSLMGIGVWLHLTERHEHRHAHEALQHAHAHVHGRGDEHHAHEHVPPVPPGTRHSHAHAHAPLVHAHAHYPDAHHRHGHESHNAAMPRYPVNQHQAYHAHVYFDAATVDQARSLCEEAGRQFKVAVGRVHERNVGPHPRWSCQLAFSAAEFDRLIPWLDEHRQGLDILVHGLSGDALRDHTEYAYWLGNAWPLDLEALR